MRGLTQVLLAEAAGTTPRVPISYDERPAFRRRKSDRPGQGAAALAAIQTSKLVSYFTSLSGFANFSSSTGTLFFASAI